MALVISDRIAVMNAGGIEQVGTPAEVYERPATAFVAGFIGRTNLLKGRLAADGRVACEGGLELVTTAGPEHPPGEAVAVSIRPHTVSLALAAGPEGPAADGARLNVFTGTVTRASYFGDAMDYQVAIAGTTCTLRAAEPRSFGSPSARRWSSGSRHSAASWSDESRSRRREWSVAHARRHDRLPDRSPLAAYGPLAAAAEAHGFDGVSVYNDLLYQPAWPALFEIARHTRRVRIGPAAMNPFTCHPVTLAGHVALLDEASRGRAYLGLARGAWLDALGIEPTRPVAALREAFECIRHLLRGDRRPYPAGCFHSPAARPSDGRCSGARFRSCWGRGARE